MGGPIYVRLGPSTAKIRKRLKTLIASYKKSNIEVKIKTKTVRRKDILLLKRIFNYSNDMKIYCLQ